MAGTSSVVVGPQCPAAVKDGCSVKRAWSRHLLRQQGGELVASGQRGGPLDRAGRDVEEAGGHALRLDTTQLRPRLAVDRELQRVRRSPPGLPVHNLVAV